MEPLIIRFQEKVESFIWKGEFCTLFCIFSDNDGLRIVEKLWESVIVSSVDRF